MKIVKKRVSRLLFVKYIYNCKLGISINNFQSLIDLSIAEYELTPLDIDLDLLYKLKDKFDGELFEIDTSQFDQITASIILAATVEYTIHQEKNLIISEYVKIAELLCVNYKFINGFLDNYFKNQLKQ